jgi:hypothetical protein
VGINPVGVPGAEGTDDAVPDTVPLADSDEVGVEAGDSDPSGVSEATLEGALEAVPTALPVPTPVATLMAEVEGVEVGEPWREGLEGGEDVGGEEVEGIAEDMALELGLALPTLLAVDAPLRDSAELLEAVRLGEKEGPPVKDPQLWVGARDGVGAEDTLPKISPPGVRVTSGVPVTPPLPGVPVPPPP